MSKTKELNDRDYLICEDAVQKHLPVY